MDKCNTLESNGDESNDDTSKQQPKKRGRKPNKEKSTEKKIPKKRGRKPKKNIIVNPNPEFDGDYDQDIIIKINQDKSDSIDEISAYKKEEEYHKFESINKSNVSKICWNCSNLLNGKIYGMPIKYIDDIFYTYGDFCSNNCCLRYAYDNYCDSKYYEIYSNLNLINKINGIDEKINLPPSKYLLEIYGGTLSFEQYTNSNNDYNVDLTNCIHINHVFSRNDNKIKNTDKIDSELKLYRKKSIFKNDINKFLNVD